ncbi:MAG: DUF4258 domain-containing protein [Chitinophagaceae bacterium]|nr:DUF4258 domain-containing protein [Chitinophagaceae bacterium]
MTKKTISFIILLLATVALLLLKRDPRTVPGNKNSTTHNDPSQVQTRNLNLNRDVSHLKYTEHAQCRMECRHITKPEVQEILRNGKINLRKSDMEGKPCPVFALEGTTSEGQRLRIVFAQCDPETKVVTCIDLDREWQCDCPGDKN